MKNMNMKKLNADLYGNQGMKTSTKVGIAVAAVVVLAVILVFFWIGWGDEGSTRIDPSEIEYKQPPGHEQALEEMEARPH